MKRLLCSANNDWNNPILNFNPPTYPVILLPPALEAALRSEPPVIDPFPKPPPFSFVPPPPTPQSFVRSLLIAFNLVKPADPALEFYRQQREYGLRLEAHVQRKRVWEAAMLEARTPAARARWRAQQVAAVLERSVPEQLRSLYSRQGVSEQHFAVILREFFGDAVRQRLGFEHPSGANERAYAPDFTLFDAGSRLRIDVEIDEPYALTTRVATHYLERDVVTDELIDSDARRNTFFLERGWLVVRFAEEQIVSQPHSCAAELARLIKRFVPDYALPPALLGTPPLAPRSRWTRHEGNRLGETRARDLYLSALDSSAIEHRPHRVTSLPAPSPLQAALLGAMRDSSDHLLVTAVAGSGKTTTLLHALRVASELKPGGRTLLVAFSKNIKTELESRLTSLGVQSVQTRTLNAFGMSLLREALGGGDHLKIRTGKYGSLVNKYAAELGRLVNLPVEPRTRPLSRDLLRKHADKLVSFCRAYGVIPGDADTYRQVCEVLSEEINRSVSAALEPIIHNVLRDGIRQAEKSGVIDFDDQCWLPVVLGLPITPYDWLLVDECQDLSSVQLELMLRSVGALYGELGSAHGRLLFVGDERQAIMGFRGADSDSIPNIRAALAGELSELPLSVCYRCPPNHLELVRRTVPQIQALSGSLNGTLASIDLCDLPNVVGSGDLVLAQKNELVMRIALTLLRSGVSLDYPISNARAAKPTSSDVESDDWETESSSGTPVLINALQSLARALEAQVGSGDGVHLDAVIARALLDCTDATERERLEYLSIVADQSDGTPLGFRRELELLTRPVRGSVTVCTAHKAKGLEASRVFIVNRLDLEPGSLHPNDGERVRVQKENLRYVTLTRAKRELYFVNVASAPDR